MLKIWVTAMYVVKFAEEAGHQVLRLLPYQCQYKLTELIWAQVKAYIAKKNTFTKQKLFVSSHHKLGQKQFITQKNTGWR